MCRTVTHSGRISREPFGDRIRNMLSGDWRRACATGSRQWDSDSSIPAVETQECKATLISDGHEDICGYYPNSRGYHAEMEALVEEHRQNLLYTRPSTIRRIEISSEPCKRCAVVLEKLGLSGKVCYRKGAGHSHMTQTGNWSYGNQKVLVAIITRGISDAETLKDYEGDIFSYFQGGTW